MPKSDALRAASAVVNIAAEPARLVTQVGIRMEQRLLPLVRPSRESEDEPRTTFLEGGRGPTIVLLNGITASAALWPSGLIRSLQADHHVIRVDNRGTGPAPSKGVPFTIADLADDVADVLRRCAQTRATVVGLSLGGLIAMELALRDPALVQRLVLLASIPPPPANTLPLDRHGAAAMAMARLLLHERVPRTSRLNAVRLLGLAGTSFRPEPVLVDELESQLAQERVPLRTAFHQARAAMGWRGPHRLARIAAVTTVVSGLDDPLIARANGRTLAKLIPRAELIELPGCGHLIPWEEPDVVRALARPKT